MQHQHVFYLHCYEYVMYLLLHAIFGVVSPTISVSNISVIASITVGLFCVQLNYHITK
jgi:hypothetical protein